MADVNSLPLKLVTPPDGRQTRIDFFGEHRSAKGGQDWLHTISSWFRHASPVEGPQLEFFNQQLEKEGYSEKSRKSYIFMMKRFFDYYEERAPRDITMGEIEDYNYEFFVSGKYSRSYQLQFINALKLFYSLTEDIDLNLKSLRKTGVVRPWRKA